GGVARDLGASAGAGDVRGGSAAAPAAGSVPRVPGAKRCVHRAVLAALRGGPAGGGGIRAGGGVRAVVGPAAAAVCGGARGRPGVGGGRGPRPRPAPRGGTLPARNEERSPPPPPPLPDAGRAGPAGTR